MKYIRITLIAVLALLMLCSCGDLSILDSQQSHDTKENNILPTDFSYVEGEVKPLFVAQLYGNVVEDDYLYYFDAVTMVRYNVKTNMRTSLCSDPLCTHDQADCPFFNFYECNYFGGKWYLLKQGFEEDGSPFRYYSCYDPITDKEEFLIRNQGQGKYSNAKQLLYDNYFYYFEVTYDEERENYHAALMRLNLSASRKVKEQVLTFDSYNVDYLLCADNGKIYFCQVGAGLYYILADGSDSFKKHFFYSTDEENFGKMMGCCQKIDDQFYITEEIKEITYFYKVDLMGKKVPLGQVEGSAIYCHFTEQGIYFRLPENRVIGMADDGKGTPAELVIQTPGIYRMAYDGTVTEICKSFSDPLMQTCMIGDITVVGNYIYTRYRHYGSTLKEVYSDQDFSGVLSGLMRIDMTSGEVIYVSGR